MAKPVLKEHRDDRADDAGNGDYGNEKDQRDLVKSVFHRELAGEKDHHAHRRAVKQRSEKQDREIALAGGVTNRICKPTESSGEHILTGRRLRFDVGFAQPEHRRDGKSDEPKTGENEKRPPVIGGFKFQSEHRPRREDQQQQGRRVGARPRKSADSAHLVLPRQSWEKAGEEIFAD